MQNQEKFNWVLQRSDTSFSSKFEQLPNGFPILLDYDSGVICEPVLLWLHESYCLPAPENWFNTVWAYASDAKDWFVFLEEIERPWVEATVADLNMYRSAMRKIKSPTTGKKYATETINRRTAAILQFYKWLRTQHHFKFRRIKPHYLLHDSCAKPNGLEPDADEDKHISVLLPVQARKLLETLGPRPSTISDKFFRVEPGGRRSFADVDVRETSRDRLSADIALRTGLRIFEIHGLTVNHFKRFLNVDVVDTKLYAIGKIKRKGGRWRNVEFFGTTIKEILVYIKCERAYLVKRFNNKSDKLLLNPVGSVNYSGKPTSKRTIQRRFHDACLKAGLRKSEFSPESHIHGANSSEAPLFVFHDLRHTYAIYTYYQRKKTDVAPWMYLQKQLDHGHVQTTIDTYLDASTLFEHIVTDRYMEDLANAT